MTEAENKMKASVEHAREEVVHADADQAAFDGLAQQLATFQVPEARVVLISPFDRGSMSAVERAIRDSDLGVNPANDGNVLRLVLPQLTEERRKEYIKVARHKAEEARVAIRANRRHAVDAVRKLEKAKEVGEDEAVRADKQLDAVTKRYEEQVNELLKAKEAELLEV